MFSQAELNQAVIKGRYEDPSAIIGQCRKK